MAEELKSGPMGLCDCALPAPHREAKDFACPKCDTVWMVVELDSGDLIWEPV